MEKMKYTCVLFDLDGTIIDTAADCACAVNLTMREFSFPCHTTDEVASYLNNGAKMLIRRALPEEYYNDEALVEQVLSRYMENYTSVCTQNSKIYDGVFDMLCKLKKNGVLLGVVTNKPHMQTKLVVPHYFGDLFGYFHGNDETVPTKPDKQRVHMALSALNKEKEQTIFVGDSYVDVETARNAGISVIGVDWGFSGKRSFEKISPDRIVSNAWEIFDIAQNGF